MKKAIRRLEEQGVLQADRPRRPGMNVRVLTLADAFVAKLELTSLLEGLAMAMPGFAASVDEQMMRLPAKTRAHLRLRGLVS